MRKNLTFIIFLILAIVLSLGNHEQKIKKANFLSSIIYYPFISSINKIESLFKIKEKNEALSLKLAEQTQKVINLEDKLQNFKKIQLDFEIGTNEFILADIIGYHGNFKEKNFILNKGKKNRIKLNYPIISNNGIVGKIISVSQNYSIVLPLDHSTFKLGVMSKRTHLQGLMESDIYENTYMTLIKQGSDINLGDTIVTSNISTIFPKGYPVGTVTKLIEAPDKVYMNAKISTFVNSACLDQVIIIFYEKDKSYESEFQNN